MANFLQDVIDGLSGKEVTQTDPTVITKSEPNPNAVWYILGGVALVLGLGWLIFGKNSPLKSAS